MIIFRRKIVIFFSSLLNILSSTDNATLLFLFSSFKDVNNMKTFLCDYQIQVYSAHARILASWYKNAFSMLHVHGLVFFKNRAQIQNL